MSVAHGRLADNIMHFARLLRGAGLAIGTGRVLDALAAVEMAGIASREDFYWTLASVLIDRRESLDIFDQAFRLYWRDPQVMEKMLHTLLPKARSRAEPAVPALSNRIADTLAPPATEREPEQRIEFDAALTVSTREVLQHKDFESMTLAELNECKYLFLNNNFIMPLIRTRRHAAALRGPRIDVRASLRASVRAGGAFPPLRRQAPRWHAAPLVVLCDISGSMSRYTRMFLLFLHAAGSRLRQLHVLTFGTRLTNITRQLRARDADAALKAVSHSVQDWSGGTRIGACLHEFNRHWSRRLLAQNASVLLLTDGLERDDAVQLAYEAQRLHMSCRALIWLNPLLRYGGFEARAAGVRALLPNVDCFLPVHNLASLRQIGDALANVTRGRIASGMHLH